MSLPFTFASPDLLADENVLPKLHAWHSQGLRTALVTLIGIEGGAPRACGAQMAVAEDGRSIGYLSGGCLENAVILEAQNVIATGKNRLVRYGKGSPYFDIRLPCGSGLDLYFDQELTATMIGEMMEYQRARRLFALETNIVSGASHVSALAAPPSHQVAAVPPCQLDNGTFTRVYSPAVRLCLFGSGPSLVAIARLAGAVGVELHMSSSDARTCSDLAKAGLSPPAAGHEDFAIGQLDWASAAVLCFHAHDAEPDLLSAILKTNSFYIGVLGNHAVHRQRLTLLAARGINQHEIDRIYAPVGNIAGAKSKTTLAIGAIGELVDRAKAINLIS